MNTMNFREPVEYIIKRYDKKRNISVAIIDDADKPKIELPEYPCLLIRSEGKVNKIIYAEGTELEWSEELVRVDGIVSSIKITYPDLSFKTIELFRDMDDKVEEIKYV